MGNVDLMPLLRPTTVAHPRPRELLFMPLWLATYAALFAYLAGEKQLKIGAQGGCLTTARWSVSGDFRGGSKGFCQVKVDRVGNISENPILRMDQNGGW